MRRCRVGIQVCVPLLPAQELVAESTGSISGQIHDAHTGLPLVRANVLLSALSHSAATEEAGTGHRRCRYRAWQLVPGVSQTRLITLAVWHFSYLGCS